MGSIQQSENINPGLFGWCSVIPGQAAQNPSEKKKKKETGCRGKGEMVM